MAVRCAACGRLSRDEAVCEWCRTEIPPEARRLTAPAPPPRAPAEETDSFGDPVASADEVALDIAGGNAAEGPDGAVDAISQEEARAAAAEVPEEVRAEDAAAEPIEPEAVVEETEQRLDRMTVVILGLILFQFLLTLYLGRFSSWWSVTGFLWVVVGYGVWQRESWALALPLVLFALDVGLLLFGVGPRERAGFFALTPLDFFLYLVRLTTWGLIWSMRDQLA